MRKIIFILCLLASPCYAEQVYNPHENKWETVPDGDVSLEYNPHTRRWSNQPNGAEIEYNPQNRSWDWSSGIDNE
jgi:hypothetical protein